VTLGAFHRHILASSGELAPTRDCARPIPEGAE
jgi:hypothetical protein